MEGKIFRGRPVENVIEEIKSIQSKSIFFTDLITVITFWGSLISSLVGKDVSNIILSSSKPKKSQLFDPGSIPRQRNDNQARTIKKF